MRMHWGEYEVKALPHLKARGKQFLNPALQPGLHKADQYLDEGYFPYNSTAAYYDRLPDDPYFFGYSAMPRRGAEDFLSGHTAYLGENAGTDVAAAIAEGASRVRLAQRDGFASQLVTHEQKFDSMSLAEWDDILAGVVRETRDLDPVPACCHDVSRYLLAKCDTRIAESTVDGEVATCALEGEAAVELRLRRFVNAEDGVAADTIRVPAFIGATQVETP